MKKLSPEIIEFLKAQGFVIVSSIDKNGFPHSSCKAIVKIDSQGMIFLIDLYHGSTGENIKRNSRINISAVEEHKFIGYCLKGQGKILPESQLTEELIKIWADNVTSRLVKRLLKNLNTDQSHNHHPEASLPQPKSIIAVEIEAIVDLAPYHLRKPV